MSMEDENAAPPVEQPVIEKPTRKRAKAKKKVVAEPAPKPRKRKAAIKKKAKTTRPVKAKRKAAKPAKRGKVKTKARKTRRKNKINIRNKLYRLLKARLPKKFMTRDGEIDFKKLIKGLRMTPEGVYKWFRGDHMAARNAMPLIKLCKGRVKPVDLIPFVF